MLTSSLKQKWQILFCRTFPTFRHQVSWRRESLVKKMLCYAQDSATIIKTYGSPTYLRTLRQFRSTALPSACCCFDHTCILVGNSLISFLAFPLLGQFCPAHNQHIISFTSWWGSRIYSLCSNWDCRRFMDPWSNRMRQFPIGGLVFCWNLRLTGKLTKITALMTNNQSQPYKELIGWYFIWEIPAVHDWHTVCPFQFFFPKTFKPCMFVTVETSPSDYEKDNRKGKEASPTAL